MYLVMTALLRKDDHEPVPLSLLANRLSISSVSANEMCRKLEERGLVSYQPYRGVTLTESGEAEAQLVLSRRRLWVVFLVENLGIEPDEADEIACQLEHITSDRLVNALKTFLERSTKHSQPPRHPIHLIDTDDTQPACQPLSSYSAGQSGQVAAIRADTVTTDFLHAQGFQPGALVEVLAVADSGAFLLSLSGHHCSLAASLAAHIDIAPTASEQASLPERACTWEKCSAFWACPKYNRELSHEAHLTSN
jgi:DtxR family Mn-dependent transcriptional regulator